MPNTIKSFLPRAHIIIIREKRTMAGVIKERKFILMPKQNVYTNVVGKIHIYAQAKFILMPKQNVYTIMKYS